MATYDPGIIKAYADGLYGQAMRLHVLCTVLGVGAGGAGAIFLGGSEMAWGAGLVGGGGVGWVIGNTLAFGMRLRAQLTLCQLQTELNTRRIAHLTEQASKLTAADVVEVP